MVFLAQTVVFMPKLCVLAETVGQARGVPASGNSTVSPGMSTAAVYTLTVVFLSTPLASFSSFLTFLAGPRCHSGVFGHALLGCGVVARVGVPGVWGGARVGRLLVPHRGTGPGVHLHHCLPLFWAKIHCFG